MSLFRGKGRRPAEKSILGHVSPDESPDNGGFATRFSIGKNRYGIGNRSKRGGYG